MPSPCCRSDQFWVWMSQVFLPYLYNNGSGQESHSTTLGAARLRQLRLQEGWWGCGGGPRVLLSWGGSDVPGGRKWPSVGVCGAE